MIKKCFVLTMFGTPFPWIDEFVDHVQHLEKYGWYWKIFTHNEMQSEGNVEFVKMTHEEFNNLVKKKTGVRPNLFQTPSGVPSVHVTDFYVASGLIFEDYLKDFDFWGITNLDVVYGRLDHYLQDSVLADCDIFTDDVGIINGVFSLFRNVVYINNLFKEIPYWKEALVNQCQKCISGIGEHQLRGTDEYGMTEVMNSKRLRVKWPPYYGLHSYDRLSHHQPKPNLKIMEDGGLCEIFEDSLMKRMPDNPLFSRGNFGREIMYFHFLTTKQWPL